MKVFLFFVYMMFPFLIGKVLTVVTAVSEWLESTVSIPYR